MERGYRGAGEVVKRLGGLGSRGRFPPSLPLERSHCLLDRPVVFQPPRHRSRPTLSPPAEACNRATFARLLTLFRCFLYAHYMYIVVRTIRQVQCSTRTISSGFRIRISRTGAQGRRGVAYDVLGCPERLEEQGRRPLPCSTAGTSQGRIGAGPGVTLRWISIRTRANG
jgi:hypothetical protein